MTGRSILKSAGMVTILLFLSRLLGFARESAIAYRYGASVEADAYFLAASIPLILFMVFNDAVKTAFIPVYGEFHQKEESNAFALTVYVVLVIILVIVTALMMIFTPQLMQLFAWGYEGRQFDLTVRLVRIMLPGLMFMGLSGLSGGILNLKKNFFIPAIVAFPHNLVIIFTAIFLGTHFGIYALAWATLLGFALQFFVQVPAVAAHGVFKPQKLLWRHPGLKKMAVLLPPVILGGAAVELKSIIDKSFATLLPEGSISALNYANKIYLLPNGILIVALLTVLYPALVEFWAQKKVKEFKNALRQGVGILIVLVFPMMVGLIVLRVPIVRFIFERNAFTAFDTANTAYALAFYALGLLPLGIMLLFNRAFFALKDTITPMLFTLVTMVINIILNWLLMRPLAHGGLALGTALSNLVGAVGMGILVWKRIGAFGGRRLLDTFWKAAVASLVMGAVVYLGAPFLQGGSFLLQAFELGVIITVGAGIYFVMAYLLKIKELDAALALLRRYFNR
ncbi:MAG: murein biosynthesis integral membrane protein MurJ [Firmicutes bacterium]|nr:murein biosynthesis integral membrane protein MurJ [Bacillota bacterium]